MKNYFYHERTFMKYGLYVLLFYFGAYSSYLQSQPVDMLMVAPENMVSQEDRRDVQLHENNIAIINNLIKQYKQRIT